MPQDKQIQVRRDTAANWTSANPVLAGGEAGYETNTGKLKYGDGSTAWNSLSYFGAGTVTSVSVVTANGISGSVATDTTTPAITITLGAITPSSVNGASSTEVGYLVGVTSAIQSQLNGKQASLGYTAENQANKENTTLDTSTSKYPTNRLVKEYADSLVVGLLDYRGGYDASSNTYPTTGGSGTAGAVVKGDMWVVSVAGTLGGNAINVGDSIIANVDTPGQTAGNWNTLESNISYVPANDANVVHISGAETITGLKTIDASTGLALPAISGSTPSAGTGLRIESSDNTILDIGNASTLNWLQSTDKTDLSVFYSLLLNPRGGNVGVGLTTTPGERFEVGGGYLSAVNGGFKGYGTGGNQLILGYDASNRLLMDVTSSGVQTWSLSGASASLNITGGNVGIGLTTAPIAKLDVSHNTSTPIRALDNRAFALGNGGGILFAGIYNTAGDATTFASINSGKADAVDGNFGGNLLFNTRANGGGNLERMRIDSSGNVGIGDASPTNYANYSTLSIRGKSNSNGGVIDLKSLDTSAHAQISLNSTALDIQTVTSLPTRFWTNSLERMRIDSSGNVGIGGTPVSGKLEVITSADQNSFFRRTGGAEIVIVPTTTYGAIGTTTAHPFLFTTNNTEKMRLTSAGRLGIGQTLPDSLIHASYEIDNGLAQATKLSDFQASAIILHNQDSPGTGNKSGLFFSHSGAGGISSGIAGYKESGNWKTGLDFYVNNITGVDVLDIQARMRINPDGDVMIGTTTPNGKLVVDDGTNTKYSVLTKSSSIGSQFYGAYSTAHIRMTYPAVSDWDILASAAGNFTIGNGSERFRINSSGHTGINGAADGTCWFQVTGNTGVLDNTAKIFSGDSSTASYRGTLALQHNSDVTIATGSGLAITFAPLSHTGGSYVGLAKISGVRENTTSNNQDTALVFLTRAGASNSTTDTEKFRIGSNGVAKFTNAVRGSETALTSSGASIAVDFNSTNDFTHTLTENTTLANPSNAVVGQSGAFRFTQHASSPKTLAYGSSYKFPGGTVPTLTATNGAADTLYYYVRSSTFIECNLVKGYA